MVVAEVPLWVVHRNASDTAAAAASGLAAAAAAAGNKKGGPPHTDDDDPTTTSAPGADNDSKKTATATRRAGQVFRMWETAGRKGRDKCAIYSIDVHPAGAKFATAGGDGTVKIWSTLPLFSAKLQQGGKFDDTTGTYVSSNSSSSSSEGGAPGGGGEGSPSSGNSSGGGGGADEDNSSSGISSGADSDKFMTSGNSTAAADAVAAAAGGGAESVHDLNDFVRRKKDGSSPTKANHNGAGAGGVPPSPMTAANQNRPPAAAAAAAAAATTSSPQHNKHNKHHQHRLLCTLSAHTGTSVLAVRFSTSGQYLASAGDDCVVCIYAPSTFSVTGNLVDQGGLTNHEHWSRIKLCRGHGLDVVGLAWAPDDSYLVSCSLDSETPIIVWKVTDLDEHQQRHRHNSNASGRNSSSHGRAPAMIKNPYKVLGRNIHTSTVKGVDFDPAGSYLASSGDDPAVCIWRAHDDWELEKRIDASAGIFRRWTEDDMSAMTSQSLFRRISWATDGSFLCSTNSVVKNKNVASTIGREGWSVANKDQTGAGAANLVGHKQPIVVSRPAPQLLNATRKYTNGSNENSGGDHDDDDEDPEYATLLALGDRRGFVTVWSTRKSRPIFKLQCSESRCTITDLAWGRVREKDLMLLVSLLDGQVVALMFRVPDEMGYLLSNKEQGRVFQNLYGIDMDDTGVSGQRRLFVGENPKLIENPLQMTMEDQQLKRGAEQDDDGDVLGMDGAASREEDEQQSGTLFLSGRMQQREDRVKGKRRVQPVLMRVEGGDKRRRVSLGGDGSKTGDSGKGEKGKTAANPLDTALDAASKASAATEGVVLGAPGTQSRIQPDDLLPTDPSGQPSSSLRHHQRYGHALSTAPVTASAPSIPFSTDRVLTAELPPLKYSTAFSVASTQEPKATVVECKNSIKVPSSSKGSAIPCIDISLGQSGRVSWKDQIPGTQCCALAASAYVFAVGSADGAIHLYGSSPTLGWSCGNAFRSHPALIIGHPIVSLSLRDMQNNDEEPAAVEMLVVDSSGAFAVYSIIPTIKLQYKSTIMPAMLHMSLASSISNERLPRLARIRITDTGRLLLVLTLKPSGSGGRHASNSTTPSRSPASMDFGVGGSLQVFVYERQSELWMRISDSRFILSDFYDNLPRTGSSSGGELSQLDSMVCLGAVESSLKSSHRDRQVDSMYRQADSDAGSYQVTRAHCEDRMACAVALASATEFKKWMALYTRTLTMGGNESLLRMLVDMLLGKSEDMSDDDISECDFSWWLTSGALLVGLNRKELIKSTVLPEMSKSRLLQRLTQEISVSLQVDTLP